MTKEITTFDLDMDGSMEPSENGQWVRYEDHLQAMTQSKPPQFPTMLRKMWSGTEVQEWINANWSKS